jgi:class 3 adenylate cyclase
MHRRLITSALAHCRTREILVSEEAHRRVEASLAGRGLAAEPAELVLKGFAAPVRAWRLRGLAGIEN